MPDKEVDTSLAVQYNAPNTEAPNTLLLCVPEKDTTEWTEDLLHRHVLHAMDLAKIRLIDTDVLDKAKGFLGFALPMTFMPIDHDYDTND